MSLHCQYRHFGAKGENISLDSNTRRRSYLVWAPTRLRTLLSPHCLHRPILAKKAMLFWAKGENRTRVPALRKQCSATELLWLKILGAVEQDWTADLVITNDVLYQLSYNGIAYLGEPSQHNTKTGICKKSWFVYNTTTFYCRRRASEIQVQSLVFPSRGEQYKGTLIIAELKGS